MRFSRRDFLSAAGGLSAASIATLRGQTPAADLVLYNGKIVTVDNAFSIREAIAIKNGRILAVAIRSMTAWPKPPARKPESCRHIPPPRNAGRSRSPGLHWG
jgi:hypothetical protein